MPLLITLPSPLDVPPVKGIDPATGEEILRHASDEEPFAALAFKLQTDPFVGQLTLLPCVLRYH